MPTFYVLFKIYEEKKTISLKSQIYIYMYIYTYIYIYIYIYIHVYNVCR